MVEVVDGRKDGTVQIGGRAGAGGAGDPRSRDDHRLQGLSTSIEYGLVLVATSDQGLARLHVS